MTKGKKVALGMSGGVDSSLCAYLLKEQGYQVTGVYLECWRAPGCRTEEDRQDALKVALALDIPFQVLDFKQAYKDKVVEYFFHEYQAGRTPNPDVMCNKEIKFGLFYDWAMKQGFDYVATGHYARVASSQQPTGNRDNSNRLVTSADEKKDQTYFLYRMEPEQLEHILFPIGHLTKSQVRAQAKRRGIIVAAKPDSQGICFIGEINVHNFIKERLGENPGDVVNTQGEVIGRHQGLWFYTVGQRHGFEISGSWRSKQGQLRHAMPPYYVISKIPEQNRLLVGFGPETHTDSLEVADLNWLIEPRGLTQLVENGSVFVRIRHGGKLISVVGLDASGETLIIRLSEPTKGIAAGQSAVLYQREVGEAPLYSVLGGGTIML